MRKFLRLLSVITCAIGAFGSVSYSQIQIRGKILLAEGSNIAFPKTVYLGAYHGSALAPVDSVSLGYDLSFSFRLPGKIKDGIYELQIGNEKTVPIILTEKDQTINLELNWSENQIAPLSFNNENEAFATFNKVFKGFLVASSNLVATSNNLNSAEQINSPDNPAKLYRLRKNYDSLQLDFNLQLSALQKKYPGTYSANILSRIVYIAHVAMFDAKSDQYESTAWMRAHYLDSIPFSEESVINNHFIKEKLNTFIYTNAHTIDDLKKNTDAVFARASQNPAVKAFTANSLIDFFLDNRMEEMVDYISENYMEGCGSQLPGTTAKRISEMKKFKVGSAVPEIKLKDPEGKEISLYSLLKKKPVLVYFWASWCDHCKQETPHYLALYDQFKSKGFKVYAISLDNDKKQWTNAISQYKLDWINVSDLAGFSSEAAKAFLVYKTPTVFLLNAEGKIIARINSPAELKERLELLFK